MDRTRTMTTIISCLERYRLDITAVQEVRWDGSGSLKANGFTILYSGGEKHERGVGFIIKNTLLSNIVKFGRLQENQPWIKYTSLNKLPRKVTNLTKIYTSSL